MKNFLLTVGRIITWPITPVDVHEGEPMKKWYGLCRFQPMRMRGYTVTYEWARVSYPIPMNFIFAFWYYLVYLTKRGVCLPPEMYRHRTFKMNNRCPHCLCELPLSTWEEKK